jgi:hypothetical protein
MTDTFRVLCAELADALDAWQLGGGPPEDTADADLIARARTALAQPEPEGVGDEELLRTYGKAKREHCYDGPIDDWPRRAERAATVHGLRAVIAADRTRYARPTAESVPMAERFEFSVFNTEYEEQAGGTAPTYAEALSYGQHYLSQYSQDGPHSLEIRRVEVLPHNALPVPGAEVG